MTLAAMSGYGTFESEPAEHTFIWVIPKLDVFPLTADFVINCPKSLLESRVGLSFRLLCNDRGNLRVEVLSNSEIYIEVLVVKSNDPKFLKTEPLVRHKNDFLLCSFEEIRKPDGKYLIDGDLILFCRLLDPNTPVYRYPTSTAEAELMRDMKTLYEKKSFADFKVTVRDKSFLCHKVILSSRSSYFKAMLQHNVKETACDVLLIKDTKSHIFEMLLQYMYANEIQPNEEDYIPLLVAADKYGIDDLKLECERYISRCVCPQNATEVHDIALKYNANILSQQAKLFLDVFGNKLDFKNGDRTVDDFIRKMGLDPDSSPPRNQERKSQYCRNERTWRESELVEVSPNSVSSADSWIVTMNFVHKKIVWNIKGFQLLYSSQKDFIQKLSFCSRTETICATWELEMDMSTITEARFIRAMELKKPRRVLKFVLYLTSITKHRMKLTTTEEIENEINRISYRFAIIDEKSFEKFPLDGWCQYINKENKGITIAKYALEADELREIENYLCNGDLVLSLYLITRKSNKFQREQPLGKEFFKPVISLRTLLENDIHTDVTLVTSNFQVKCHKAILAARCQSLASRLQNMDGNELEVYDMNSVTMKQVLSRIYGVIENEEPRDFR